MPMRVLVRRLRKEGKKVGFVRLKWFRPFPKEEIQAILPRFKAVGVIDRDYSFGSPDFGGVLYNEVKATLYACEKRPPVLGFIAGLGGREVTIEDGVEISEMVYDAANTGRMDNPVRWIGVREGSTAGTEATLQA
jgi:pyruvate ferredoxin oxidoreductase alpha subunit